MDSTSGTVVIEGSQWIDLTVFADPALRSQIQHRLQQPLLKLASGFQYDLRQARIFFETGNGEGSARFAKTKIVESGDLLFDFPMIPVEPVEGYGVLDYVEQIILGLSKADLVFDQKSGTLAFQGHLGVDLDKLNPSLADATLAALLSGQRLHEPRIDFSRATVKFRLRVDPKASEAFRNALSALFDREVPAGPRSTTPLLLSTMNHRTTRKPLLENSEEPSNPQTP